MQASPALTPLYAQRHDKPERRAAPQDGLTQVHHQGFVSLRGVREVTSSPNTRLNQVPSSSIRSIKRKASSRAASPGLLSRHRPLLLFG